MSNRYWLNMRYDYIWSIYRFGITKRVNESDEHDTYSSWHDWAFESIV